MCKNQARVDKSLIPHFDKIHEELNSFQEDGILTFSNGQIKISEVGKIFVRNVAMCFDFHLKEQKTETKFSQTI